MTTMLSGGTKPARLHGGPYKGQTGDVVIPAPLTLAVGPEGGFVYVLDRQSDVGAHYRYAPDLSPFHPAMVEADRQAIEEVAEREGVYPEVIVARLAAARTADPKRRHPADELFDEAERLGVDPLVLIQRHHAQIAEEATP
jgi:hypothetical protein